MAVSSDQNTHFRLRYSCYQMFLHMLAEIQDQWIFCINLFISFKREFRLS